MKSLPYHSVEINKARLAAIEKHMPIMVHKVKESWPLAEGNRYYKPSYPAEISCPCCNTQMKYRDTRPRSVRRSDGACDVYFLWRCECSECKRRQRQYLHTVYPAEISQKFRYSPKDVEAIIDTYRSAQKTALKEPGETAVEFSVAADKTVGKEPEKASESLSSEAEKRDCNALFPQSQHAWRMQSGLMMDDIMGCIDERTVRRWIGYYTVNEKRLTDALLKSPRADKLRLQFTDCARQDIEEMLMSEPGWFGRALLGITAEGQARPALKASPPHLNSAPDTHGKHLAAMRL